MIAEEVISSLNETYQMTHSNLLVEERVGEASVSRSVEQV